MLNTECLVREREARPVEKRAGQVGHVTAGGQSRR